MKITAIKQQIKNPERVSVFVDDKYSFSLHYDQLLSEALRKGMGIDGERLKALHKSSAEGKLKLRALEWLLRRPHSIREFRDYMRRKQAEPDMVDMWIEDFCTRGYLNDQTFAKWFTEQRRVFKQKSTRAIIAELGSKGISPQVISEVLAGSGNDEMTALKSLLVKKMRSNRYQDRKKLVAYLVGRGYSYSSVLAALAEAEDAGEE